MITNTNLPLELWLKIIKTVTYLYNYILNKSTLENNGEELINLIISFFQKLDIDCFNLLHYIEYCYFRVYGYKTFIYILKNIKIQSQKLVKRTKKGFLIDYKGNLIY